MLHNGISLPQEWPPRYQEANQRMEMPVPYLINVPEPIPINTGRQLFVDDFLISKTNLKRIYHRPDYYSGNPVLEPDKKWEYALSGAPYAAPFSDGVWYDELDQKYKMWYLAGAPMFDRGRSGFYTCYAESNDGLKWEKPLKHIYPGTNIVDLANRDAATIWLDKLETNSGRRYKLFNVEPYPSKGGCRFVLKYSTDGIHWTRGIVESNEIHDRSSVFFNPFTKKWVVSLRHSNQFSTRCRAYLEHENVEVAIQKAGRMDRSPAHENVVFWFCADDKEPRNPKFPEVDPAIYNFDAIAYESIMLGSHTVWQGPENDACKNLGIQKRNEILLGYSRDGFHFFRPSHLPFLGVNETPGAWNWGNVQSVNGAPLIVGDSLFFYCSGRKLNNLMWDGYMSTGMAVLRRDGFVSLRSEGANGFITTRILNFEGEHLFANANTAGDMEVEVLDDKGNVIPGFSREDCKRVRGDSTKHRFSWKTEVSLATLKKKRIRFRFHISHGNLYAFWVSPWKTGESRGYTSGGGPGLHNSGIDIPLTQTPESG